MGSRKQIVLVVIVLVVLVVMLSFLCAVGAGDVIFVGGFGEVVAAFVCGYVGVGAVLLVATPILLPVLELGAEASPIEPHVRLDV